MYRCRKQIICVLQGCLDDEAYATELQHRHVLTWDNHSDVVNIQRNINLVIAVLDANHNGLRVILLFSEHVWTREGSTSDLCPSQGFLDNG